MTQQELREGSLADMVVRIATERRSDNSDVVSAEATQPTRARRAFRPRAPGRLFPDAPRRG